MISIRTICQLVEDSVTSIKLPGEFGENVSAFQAVRQYDLQGELVKALEELLVFKDRVAFILLDSVGYENELEGGILLSHRQLSLTVLCADRNWGSRQKALKGDATTPGVQLLQELIIEELCGEISEGAVIEPGQGQLFSLSGKDRDNAAGRLAWSQEFNIHANSPASPVNQKLL
jgi:hypothetical protein